MLKNVMLFLIILISLLLLRVYHPSFNPDISYIIGLSAFTAFWYIGDLLVSKTKQNKKGKRS